MEMIMRKSERTCDEGEQPSRRWIRGPIAPPKNPAPARPAKAKSDTDVKPAKRFVEPYPYTDEQRAAIAAALATDGIGDDTAREIFIGAIAYDLALLQAATAETPPAPDPASVQSPVQTAVPTSEPAHAEPGEESKSDTLTPEDPERLVVDSIDAGPDSEPLAGSSLASLSETACSLAASLRALDHDQRRALGVALQRSDAFDRSHDEGYLNAVASESERIAQAAGDLAAAPVSEPVLEPLSESASQPVSQPASTAPPKAAPETPAPPTRSEARAASAPAQSAAASPHPAALAFIRHAANVFEQCFDHPPALKANEPFARVLSSIGKTTGIPVPSQVRVLRQALARR
jgi:hypothetical protein